MIARGLCRRHYSSSYNRGLLPNGPRVGKGRKYKVTLPKRVYEKLDAYVKATALGYSKVIKTAVEAYLAYVSAEELRAPAAEEPGPAGPASDQST